MALVRGLPDRGRARRRDGPCRCRWTPTPGTASRRCSRRSPSAPASCWSAPPTTRPGRWSTRTSSSAFLDRVPRRRAGGDRRGLPRVRHRHRGAGRARARTGSGPTSRCCGPSRRPTGWPACGWGTPSRTSPWRRRCARPRCRSVSVDIAQRPPSPHSRRTTSSRRASTRWWPSAPAWSEALREQGWSSADRGQLRVVAAGRTTRSAFAAGGTEAGLDAAAVRRRRRALHHRRDRGQRPADRTWQGSSSRRCAPEPAARATRAGWGRTQLGGIPRIYRPPLRSIPASLTRRGETGACSPG